MTYANYKQAIKDRLMTDIDTQTIAENILIYISFKFQFSYMNFKYSSISLSLIFLFISYPKIINRAFILLALLSI